MRCFELEIETLKQNFAMFEVINELFHELTGQRKVPLHNLLGRNSNCTVFEVDQRTVHDLTRALEALLHNLLGRNSVKFHT